MDVKRADHFSCDLCCLNKNLKCTSDKIRYQPRNYESTGSETAKTVYSTSETVYKFSSEIQGLWKKLQG